MEFNLYFIIYFLAVLIPTIFLIRRISKPRRLPLPPSPPAWPLFGHIFSLGSMPQRTVAGLAKEYGPVLWLKIGAVNTVVIQSAKASAELFKNHDLTFVDRTITETSRSHDYDKGSLALAPYGPYWRVLRRISSVEMLVAKRINETAHIRKKCTNDMLRWIEQEAKRVKAGEGIHVAKYVFLASFNLLGNLMLSRDLAGPDSEMGKEFYDAMMGLMEWGGHPNISDVFPWLKHFDLQGIRKKMDRDIGKALEIATGFIKERIKEREQGKESRKDFLDVLLDFEGNGKDEPEKLSERGITFLILEIFLAGSETTSSTIEWALTELLRSPGNMAKVKAELDSVIGPNNEFEEHQLDNLPFLQAVIKETFRLHPPIPFLVPRKAGKDTDFMGYFIPKNTQLFVNAWAIGRDPEVWDDPSSFKPERFLGSKVDYKGQHYELIPFGAGRRICAGLPLAHRVLHLVLGSMLHEFDWKLDSQVTADTVDMRDKMGITVRKLEPLKAVPKRIAK